MCVEDILIARNERSFPVNLSLSTTAAVVLPPSRFRTRILVPAGLSAGLLIWFGNDTPNAVSPIVVPAAGGPTIFTYSTLGGIINQRVRMAVASGTLTPTIHVSELPLPDDKLKKGLTR